MCTHLRETECSQAPIWPWVPETTSGASLPVPGTPWILLMTWNPGLGLPEATARPPALTPSQRAPGLLAAQ